MHNGVLMNTIQRISKNISILFVSQILTYILGFLTLAYTARYLGVAGYGTLSFALAFTQIFSVLMDLGLNTFTIREVARKKSLAEDYVANISLIKVILGAITFFLIITMVHILGYNLQTIQIVAFIALYTIFFAFSQLFYAVFQANEKMEYPSLGNIISSILLFIGVFTAIHYGFNIYQFSHIYAFTGAIILIYAVLMYSWRFNLPKIKFEWSMWKYLMKKAWPFAITGISINLYLYIDSIILSLFQGQEAVGFYNAAYRLIVVLLFIPIIFNNALFPLMSQYFISSKESLNYTFDKLFKIMILIGFPLATGTVIISNQLIILIYGTQYVGAVIVLQILIWSTFLIFARSPFERLLESSDKQLSVTKIFILGAIFNTILNIIVIPQFSYVGAAIITVLTDILVLGLLIFTVKKSNDIIISKNTKISLIKILTASLIMGLVINYLKFLNVFLLISIGTMFYLATILIMKIFDDEEIAIIKSLFRRNTD